MKRGYAPALYLATIGLVMLCVGIVAITGWKIGMVAIGIIALVIGSISYSESLKGD